MNARHPITDTLQDSNFLTCPDPDHPEPCLIKHYRRKPLTLKMIKYTVLRALGIPVPVEYRTCAQRRDFERQCLTLWRLRGFQAPAVRHLPDEPKYTAPALGISFVAGERLDRYLSRPAEPIDRKLETIGRIYAEMHQRHCLAIFEQNHLLIHYDANLRNILVVDGRPVHIDFEMGHLNEDIDTSAIREIKKLTLQLLNHCEATISSKILPLLFANYRITHILRKMNEEEFQRVCYRLHAFRDKRKKGKRPGLITKIDLAHAVRKQLDIRSGLGAPAAGDEDLVRAIETSWDGKYYQSLEDGDPRGRDMPHRYRVMGFPEHFENSSILDIGCNIGRICVDAEKRGARRAIGLDFRQDVVDAMNRYFQRNSMNVTLYAFDINAGVEALARLIGTEPFDYVCALSIWSHVSQRHLWDIINRFCAKTFIFEDNSPSRVKSLDTIRTTLTQNLDFSKVEFMGFTTDRGVRAVFRMEK